MTVLRVCYRSGVRFDHGYYRSRHLPLASEVMGPYGVTSVEVATFGPNPDGSTPPYQLMLSAYFASASALARAMQSPRIGEVMGDVPNFYDGMPDVMVGDVVEMSEDAANPHIG